MNPRIRAFSIHLLASLFTASIMIALVFLIWYPHPLHTALGVTKVFLILLIVDVILGPLLTLLIYKPNKKNLLFDLSVIALIQLSALSYGLYTVTDGRPVWLVFSDNKFELVRALDIDERLIKEAQPEYQHPSWLGPKWVAAVSPKDSKIKSEILFEAIFAGIDIAQRPNLYTSLYLQAEAIKEELLELSDLSSFNTEKKFMPH